MEIYYMTKAKYRPPILFHGIEEAESFPSEQTNLDCPVAKRVTLSM